MATCVTVFVSRYCARSDGTKRVTSKCSKGVNQCFATQITTAIQECDMNAPQRRLKMQLLGSSVQRGGAGRYALCLKFGCCLSNGRHSPVVPRKTHAAAHRGAETATPQHQMRITNIRMYDIRACSVRRSTPCSQGQLNFQ